MPKSKTAQTHWLQNPNKNYLGHWDLPEDQDLILTIKSAGWEDVKNPVSRAVENKRVIRFEEDYKPFICNETNAKAIFKSIGEGQMEKASGKRIKLAASRTTIGGEQVDCIRVKPATQEELRPEKISAQQAKDLEALLEKVGKDKIEFCESLKIKGIPDVPLARLEKIITYLNQTQK